MNPIKALVRRLPGGKKFTDRISYWRRQRTLEKIGDAEDRFTHIYSANKWKDDQSRSGAGSSAETTAELRAALPGLLRDLQTHSILDAPCGDYNWFRLIERSPELSYVGGDIVKPLIDANNATYSNDTTRFMHLDVTADELPNVGIWLCRDCLIHLSYADIERAVASFLESDIPYWLVTTHARVEENIDIPTGHCRLLNLEIAPFNFGKPQRYVDDTDHSDTGKCLGLWERDALAATLRNAAESS